MFQLSHGWNQRSTTAQLALAAALVVVSGGMLLAKIVDAASENPEDVMSSTIPQHRPLHTVHA